MNDKISTLVAERIAPSIHQCTRVAGLPVMKGLSLAQSVFAEEDRA